MGKSTGLFSKDRANWWAPAIAAVGTLAAFSVFKIGTMTKAILSAIGLGGIALMVSQAVTKTGMFDPKSLIPRKIEDIKKEVEDTVATPERGEGPRFDRLMVDLLEKNEGIFLGESHDKPMVVQSISMLLPALKARGVETIGVERNQEQMANYQILAHIIDGRVAMDDPYTAQVAREIVLHTAADEWAMGKLISDAKKAGIEVIGYEMSEEDMRRSFNVSANNKKVDDMSLEEREIYIRNLIFSATNNQGMAKRDAWSADFIKNNKKGKIVLIGGAAHSGNFNVIDSLIHSDDTYGDIKSYQGINKLLDYPAIDFMEATPEHKVGSTEKTDGRFNDYRVYLNGHMEDLNTSCWPPAPGTTPYVSPDILPNLAESLGK